jgi:hypothetical protein
MGAPRNWLPRCCGLCCAWRRRRAAIGRLAMLRELDFIEGEWAALFWALGSAAAILRHAASGWRAWLKRKSKRRRE